MTTNTIIAKVNYLKSLEATMEELKAAAENIKNELKEEMVLRQTEQMSAGDYIIRYGEVLTSRFDTKRFKEEIGEDVYKYYTKEILSKRFSIA